MNGLIENTSVIANDAVVLSYCRPCGVVHPEGNHESYLSE